MPRLLTKPFNPPTPDQVASYLARHFVTGPSRWTKWFPALLLGTAIILAVSWHNQALVLFTSLLLLGLFVSQMVRARSLKDIEQKLSHVQEFTLRRHHVQALRVIWRLIPQLRAQPQMHTKAVALLAHNLQLVHAYDASAVAFDYVIDKLPDDHPASLQLRVEQVMALLASDQLTDADNTLRKLRFVLDKFPDTIISAGYCLGAIYQQVRTNHFQDILDDRNGVMERLRPLGIDAAVGYAMIALACFHMRQTDAQLLSQATLWWDRACLLMSSDAMVGRFEELKSIRQGPAVAAQADALSAAHDDADATAGGGL